jgi:dethiobiotin synthetase
MKGLFISGSGTDVGKTFVASYIIRALNAKYFKKIYGVIGNYFTTVQEKNITYPTDAKLAIKIINRRHWSL